MRLIHVRTFLDVEEGKRVDLEAIVLKDLVDEDLARIKYGILSHCWGDPKEEVQFKEMDALIRMGGPVRKKLRQRSGYQKIHKSCEQAWKDGLAWLWVDTCCINKESSAELSEALNSMFRWYEDSARCYVFLHDLDAKNIPTTSNEKMFPNSSGWPKWFSRGWTLQELVAPNVVHFFNKAWQYIGDKKNHAQTISSITQIPSRILRHGLDAHRPSAAQIMSWAADRKTTRTEDRAYSLMGLFGVHMPMLYGEGKNAFRRLQLEIIRMANDHSIFAWDRKDNGWSGSVLADDPSFFRDCHDIINMEPDEYLAALKGVVPDSELSAVNEESIRTYTVTNAGIRIRLPLQRCRGSRSVFEARLACCRAFDSSPISIFLVSFKSTHYRYFGQSQTIHGATATFRLLYLVCREEKRQKDFTFKIDDRALECEGFIQRCVFPKRAPLNPMDNSITLSYTHHCAIIVYANSKSGTCFALAVGYCSGYEWLHVISDTPPAQQFFNVAPTTVDPWDSYAHQIYDRMWVVSPKHAPRVAQAHTPTVAHLHREEDGPCLVKHAHLPRSIRGVQIVYQRLPQPNTCFVTMDITRCAGCCVSPDVWQTLDGLSTNDFSMPGLMLDPAPQNPQVKRNAVHRFLVDGAPTSFLSAFAEPCKIKLGDYGLHTESAFVREGNLFEDIGLPTTNLHINPMDPIPQPIEHRVWPEDCTVRETNVIESVSFDRRLNQWEVLDMWNPKARSLPIHPRVFSHLKDLSRHLDLEDRWLVTTVVECTDCSGARAQNIMGIPPMWTSSGVFYKREGHRKTLSTTTPLFISMKPLVWREEKADESTRALFGDIRKYFSMLSQFYQQDMVEGDNPAAIKQTKRGHDAVMFFRNIFGGGRFRGYIGDISFSKLSRAIDDSGSHAKNKEQSTMSVNQNFHVTCEAAKVEDYEPESACSSHETLSTSSDSNEKSETAEDARVVALAETLMKRMPTEDGGLIDQKLWSAEKIKMYHEAEELRSTNFGLQLLHVISTSYHRSSEGSVHSKHSHTHAQKVGSSIRSLIQDVRILEDKLDNVEDEDEKRALEEDIAGKILLACWRGVRSEIEQILYRVANHIVTDARVERDGRKQRSKLLREVGDVFKHATNDGHGESRGCHLRRIVVDAEENTSKYELLLTSRAAPRTMQRPGGSPSIEQLPETIIGDDGGKDDCLC